ncbi:ABC-three component system protein [Paraburkholderia azotifigens]|uniref:ABC-three component system protein n=1 Tax=Paraburkholderia azotifigens TaxID=2057004 RepID=UPI00317AAB4E
MNKRDRKSKIEAPIDTNASSTIVAFTFQFERALFRLFSSHRSDIQVGLETLDDVAELRTLGDGTVEASLEQDANTVQSSGQPFQDSSRKLWHTLRIWLGQIERLKESYPEVVFCAATNATVPPRALIHKLASPSSTKEVAEAIKLLRDQAKVIASNPKSEAKADAAIVAKYKNADLGYLIKRLVLLHKGGTGSDVQPREATIQLFQLHSAIVSQGEDIYRSLLGTAVDMCQKGWRANEPVWLTPQPFRDRLRDEMDRRSLDRYLDRPLMSTKFKEYVAAGGRDHFFLKQLTRIDLPARMIDEHLNAFWGFYTERVRLTDEGVHQKDWDDREEQLHERWKACRNNTEVKLLGGPSKTDEEFGRLVLINTLDATYKAPLGRYPTNNLYFTHGHYHQLANNPGGPFFVHWHPAYSGETGKVDDEEGTS